jgi:hypothetical protein
MDRMQATPRVMPFVGGLADMLTSSYSPERTQQMQGLMRFLQVPDIAQTLDRVSYGEPITTGAGMTTALRPEAKNTLGALLGLVPIGRAAEPAAVATGRALEPVAGRVAEAAYDRGGLAREMVMAMGQGTQSKIFIGPEARTWNRDAAMRAVNMERQGATPQEIWAATGTARGPDRMWRQEISDREASISQARLPSRYIEGAGDVPAWTVGQALNHPQLMAAYPDIAKIESSFFNSPIESARAMMRPGKEMKDSWLSYAESMYKRPFITKRQQDQIDKAKKEYQDFISDPKFKEYNAKIERAFDEGKPLDNLLDLELEAKRNQLSDSYFGLMRTINSGDSPSGYTLGSGQSAKSSTMHELQHAIQEQERFGVGGNMRDFARMRDDAMQKIKGLNDQMTALVRRMDDPATTAATKAELKKQYDDLLVQRQNLVPTAQIDPEQAYGHLMGEAEARLVQRRLDLTPEQRRQNFPFQFTGETGLGFDVDPARMILMTPEGQITERGLLGSIGR